MTAVTYMSYDEKTAIADLWNIQTALVHLDMMGVTYLTTLRAGLIDMRRDLGQDEEDLRMRDVLDILIHTIQTIIEETDNGNNDGCA